MPYEQPFAELLLDPRPEVETVTLANGETVSAETVKELGGEAVSTTQAVENIGEKATEAYFHGTDYPFRVGDRVVPGSFAVRDKDGALHASATTDERTAWLYAGDKESYGGRGRVFKVVPTDGQPAQRLGPQLGEVNSPTFTVVDEINIKPGHQGTFPEVNWSKHTSYEGTNHPEDPPYMPESDWKPYDGPLPNDVPIPELGQEYVDSELERIRVASGRPRL